MKTVSLVHSADIHLGKQRFNREVDDIDFFNGFNQVVDYCIDKNVDGLLLAGDIFDRHQITAQTLLKSEEIFNRLKEKKIPVIAIYGNHDGTLTKSEFNWLDYLSQRELVQFLKIPFQKNEATIDQWNPDKKEGGVININGINIYGLGYLGSTLEHRMDSIIDKIDHSGFNILLLHADLKDRVYDERGKLKDQDLIARLKEKIDYLALGHIHSSYIKDDWAYNPGSLENWRIHEADYDKGFFHVLINPETKEKSVTLKKINRRKTFLFEKKSACDLAGCQSVTEAYTRVRNFVNDIENNNEAEIPSGSIVRLALSGGLFFSPGEVETELIAEIWSNYDLYYLEIVNECYRMEDGLVLRNQSMTQAEIEKEELINEINKSSKYKEHSENLAQFIQELMVKKSEKSITDEEIFSQVQHLLY